MASTQSPEVSRMRHARKSIAHMPSTGIDINKENSTTGGAAIGDQDARDKQSSKKSRSKSLGPERLDALKEDSGNKRVRPNAVCSNNLQAKFKQPSLPPNVKSILKPTIALSPPKAIPPHSRARKSSPSKENIRRTPEKSPGRSPSKHSQNGLQGLSNPFAASPKVPRSPTQSPIRVAVRTEEEQQAAAKEREKQEALAYKEARRKSLANRRVSFAPEATLHTWKVVELPEDSTTSSASNNSTRRASAFTANLGSPYTTPRSPMPSSDASEPPSTPPEQVEETQVAASPVHQRDLHQKKRRRSSGIPPMNFNNPEDFSSSPYSGADDDTNQSFVTAEEIDKDSESSSSNDGDVVEEETITGIDKDDNTLRSTGSNSSSSSGRLEAALQQAAAQAGTQGIEHDEHGDITMEMADDEITNAFKPWMKRGNYAPQVVGDPSAWQDQENLNPFSPAFKASVVKTRTEEEDRTMEMTQAVGGILPAAEESQGSPKRRHRKSITGTGTRRSSAGDRRHSGNSSVQGDKTIHLTTAVGAIQQDQKAPKSQNQGGSGSDDDDEEMTMEFTSVIGGVVQPSGNGTTPASNSQHPRESKRRESSASSIASSDNDETMDITFAAGGILPSITERTEPSDDQTQGMDITRAIGRILPEQLRADNKAEAKALMERETDVGQLSGSPFFGTPRQKPAGVGLTDERPLPGHAKTMASETGSPSLASSQPRSQSSKNLMTRASVTPKSQQPTPVKKPSTPSKQLTPQPTRPTTPGKTPPSKNVAVRSASPKKLFKAEMNADVKSTSNSSTKPISPHPLFNTEVSAGAIKPRIELKPHRRRSSGLGADREGLGSPQVTNLLDRRSSIGKSAKAFVSQGPPAGGVRFADPKVIEQEIDQNRAEDKRRESGRGIMEDEADSQDLDQRDSTTNLKNMIERLTPQKKKLKGRKSLHVGAAKGLLGKRPAELDEDEDDDTPKRLKVREGSPVKNVKLPAPPSKAATIGRMTRSTRSSLGETSGNVRPATPSETGSSLKVDTTPKDQPRFKNVETSSPAKVASFEEKLAEDKPKLSEPTEQEDRIHLQDFLNMTNIRFMELTTTKRRHTIMPTEDNGKKLDLGAQDRNGEAISQLENSVVAGACTVPMLELYQHSCRELKNYIAEGRSIVKEIEADTYEENPPLFREYMSAAPDVKPIMDNQFKNVKTHARLLSKAMWYEWRMKLLDGLKEGLVKIGEGMTNDERLLMQQEQMMQPLLPKMIEEHDHLESQVQRAQAQADEMADCDQDELNEARESLVSVDQELQNKQELLEKLQSELREKENILEDVVERKQECADEIKEAERTRQDCRGWSFAEVSALQANVDKLESAYGWTITSAADGALTMTYDRTLQLFFMPSSFRPNNEDDSSSTTVENSPISLTYIADAEVYHPQPLTTEKRFFLQIMRAQLQCLQQSETTIKELLVFISTSWKTASSIVSEVHRLGVSYITEPTITSDEVMAVRSLILLQAMRTKVEVCLEVKVRCGDTVSALATNVKASAEVCYGETLKEKKMGEFLESKIKGARGKGVWVKAMRELEERLIARGKKA
ncbi:hypothetical protein ACLMJK_005953 [Lecanora helva]